MNAADLYRDSATHALAGFQLVEEMLKSYLEHHFNAVRRILAGRIDFNFHRDDYKEAPLGRLVQLFSKLCGNEKLVLDLRAAVRDRDHLAHRAFLRLYDIPPPSDEEFLSLCEEANRMMNVNSDLMNRIVAEMSKLSPDRTVPN